MDHETTQAATLTHEGASVVSGSIENRVINPADMARPLIMQRALDVAMIEIHTHGGQKFVEEKVRLLADTRLAVSEGVLLLDGDESRTPEQRAEYFVSKAIELARPSAEIELERIRSGKLPEVITSVTPAEKIDDRLNIQKASSLKTLIELREFVSSRLSAEDMREFDAIADTGTALDETAPVSTDNIFYRIMRPILSSKAWKVLVSSPTPHSSEIPTIAQK